MLVSAPHVKKEYEELVDKTQAGVVYSDPEDTLLAVNSTRTEATLIR